MSMEDKPIDFWGWLLIITLLLSLSYAGYLAYVSIDWDVLKHLEAQPLILPTPVPTVVPLPATPSGVKK